MTSGNDPTEELARELYWAEDATPRSRMTSAEVRDAIHDFAILLREDEKQFVPRGEPNLASVSPWKRRLKLRLFRVLRPVSRRYDRLLGDLAELSAALADRLARTEAELARLREQLAERDETRSR